ncbi:hypothetical protein BAOM_3037 [Peribacillus asahii]|uniref:Uncharacterized protein n=1 Tax=Peribacillus asahii TaxID=228899 RepID=A0A3Q9RNL8_9BACI|nr:hypothetical protein [Peribacillus asahii]AZV43646.1 hypothetical protein BAOM_3037 [Peribacillus asahii]
MYLIKWIENGKEKSFVADAWIVRDVYQEELAAKGIHFTTELI